jgi:hypothetical protein
LGGILNSDAGRDNRSCSRPGPSGIGASPRGLLYFGIRMRHPGLGSEGGFAGAAYH